MDQLKLRSLVFEKTGVRVDVDDPIFALVALNEAVLEDAVERHVALIEAASRELAGHARAAGGLAAPQPAGGGAAPAVAITDWRAPLGAREWRLLAAAAGVAALTAALVVGAQALLRKPSPAPAPQAKELTPEQVRALREGEKLARAVQKLDPKSRAMVQAELQK